ncbi:tRNA glutamyl-Q(34) synthetase GluQRS [Acidihalobacter ferrooxydans]|uniref:Glutamyl-Q tRNA(Asp) synthetase n=1 Tax=Acidihalobacter ferrooxydans TaxID=1765967 RepID=A0A1P8UL13_9GAMM|nr:tRNA glutamyl-Q(34) synthetase GluQRS [Acidihalobacter ferrooxydans]
MPATPRSYRGRFAPSPTGSLHFGSLIAALGSFLCARQAHGEWLLRIEDLDPPRERPAAAGAILRTLAHHGLEWDGPVLYQSQRSDAYEQALAALRTDGWLYECSCTRSEIARRGTLGPCGPIYPNTCRNGPREPERQTALRVRTDDRPIGFTDALQGVQRQILADVCGDFVVRRADGLYAYQLAVVVDDAAQGITDIVRGADLLDSTARQIHLQHLLALPTPRYLHLPIAVNGNGEKLSKTTHALALDNRDPTANLGRALAFLGHEPPRELLPAQPQELLDWARQHWNPAAIPRRINIPITDTPVSDTPARS